MSALRAVSLITLRSSDVALIDDIDSESVTAFKWHSEPHGHTRYVVRRLKRDRRRTRIYLHRFLMTPGPGFVVDHINGNGLDNRRANLRVCRQEENLRNRRQQTSHYKGISWTKGRFQVLVAGKYIGRYATDIEAALAYDHAAKQMFGEFARLNFPAICLNPAHSPEPSNEVELWHPNETMECHR